MLGPVPLSCEERLTAHYGSKVRPWLKQVPEMLVAAAEHWDLRPVAYHDAGHASMLATAATSCGRPVLLKAWFDPQRFVHEIAALTAWEGVNGRVVRSTDDDHAVAALWMVSDRPGGAPIPRGSELRVADALSELHRLAAPRTGFPELNAYMHEVVTPRIEDRIERYSGHLPGWCMDAGTEAMGSRRSTGRMALLHGDLYRENVVFTVAGAPVFIDPLPMVGDPVFDWAFFVVYHDLMGDPITRLGAATSVSGISVDVLIPWCLMLCLDGLLYYHEERDPRELRMTEVIGSLVALKVGR